MSDQPKSESRPLLDLRDEHNLLELLGTKKCRFLCSFLGREQEEGVILRILMATDDIIGLIWMAYNYFLKIY